MARLLNTLLGKIKGKVGSLTFFGSGNDQFLKPSKLPHKKSNMSSIPAKNNRKRFAQSHYFSKCIIKNPEIFDFWKLMDIKGKSPYFKMFGWNRNKSANNSLTENNGITPDSISLSVDSLTLNKSTLSFKYKLFRTSNSYLKLPYQLYVVAYLNIGEMSQKLHDDVSLLQIVNVEKETEEFTQVEVKFLDTLSDDSIPKYKKLYFFIAAVKKIPEKNKYEWSASYFKVFDIANLKKGWYNSVEIK